MNKFNPFWIVLCCLFFARAGCGQTQLKDGDAKVVDRFIKQVVNHCPKIPDKSVALLKDRIVKKISESPISGEKLEKELKATLEKLAPVLAKPDGVPNWKEEADLLSYAKRWKLCPIWPIC